LLGGIPAGGSVGVPGVAGGISGGSIGIYIVTLRFSPRSGFLGAVLPSQTYARWPRSFLASLLAMRLKGRDPSACRRHNIRDDG
jgi:hypothetical protein